MIQKTCVVVYGRPSAPSRSRQSKASRSLLNITLRPLVEHLIDFNDPGEYLALNSRGKPVTKLPSIEISITHCPTLVAVAVMSGGPGPIGVDVEELRPLDLSTLRNHVVGTMDGLITDEASFLRAWVRKEALAKATGDGLRVDFSTIGVGGESPLGPLISYDGKMIPAQIIDVDLGADHVAAFAVLNGSQPPKVTVHDAGQLP